MTQLFQDKNLRSVCLFILSAVLVGGFFMICSHHQEIGREFLIRYAYYVVFLMSGLWLLFCGPLIREFLKKKGKAVLVALLLTSAVFISMPPHFRVLSDETNLLSVAQNMAQRHEINNITEAKFYYENFHPVVADLPTRPLLFPFFVSIVHTVSGYRYQNGFALNFIFLFSIFLMAYLIVEPVLGAMSAWAACLLLLSIPTLTLSATSAGFDVCSLAFFIFSFVVLAKFLVNPTSLNFAALSLQLIMLSQIRYESAIYGVIMMGALLFTRRIKWKFFTDYALIYACVPIFFLPLLLQRKYLPNTYENPPGVPPFSIQHFFKHGKMLIEGMLFFKTEYPFPSILNLVALVFLFVGLSRLMPRLKDYFNSAKSLFALVLISCVAVSLVIVLSHHFGVFAHPTQARLFLVFLTALAMVPVAFQYFFPTALSSRALFAIALTSVAIYHPISMEGQFTNSLTLIRETTEEYRFLESLHEAPNMLLIAERPGQFTVANIGAVGFGYANQNKATLKNDLDRHLISNIWVFQHRDYANAKPMNGQALDPEFVLEPVKEFMITPNDYVQISRVKHGFFEAPPPSPTPALNKDFRKIYEHVKFK